MNVVFWGTPNFCIPIFEAIKNSNNNILAVVTQPDKRRGRGKELIFSPVKEAAIKEQIPIFTPKNISLDIEIQKELSELKADIYIVVAFGQILPESVLNQPKYGCWNIHASLLPKWRGAAPIQWSIINGDKETGIGIMHMEKGLDTGPILVEEKIAIKPLENTIQLSSRLSEIASRMILNSIKKITSSKNNYQENIIKNLINQNTLNREIKYARMIKKKDYIVEWNKSAIEIHNLILGLYPNAYTFIKGKRIKLISCCPYKKVYLEAMGIYHCDQFVEKNYESRQTGSIVEFINDTGVLVKAKNSLLIILKAKIEGKSEQLGKRLIQQLKNYDELLFG